MSNGSGWRLLYQRPVNVAWLHCSYVRLIDQEESPRYEVCGAGRDWEAYFYPAPESTERCDDTRNACVHFDDAGSAIAFCEIHRRSGSWPRPPILDNTPLHLECRHIGEFEAERLEEENVHRKQGEDTEEDD